MDYSISLRPEILSFLSLYVSCLTHVNVNCVVGQQSSNFFQKNFHSGSREDPHVVFSLFEPSPPWIELKGSVHLSMWMCLLSEMNQKTDSNPSYFCEITDCKEPPLTLGPLVDSWNQSLERGPVWVWELILWAWDTRGSIFRKLQLAPVNPISPRDFTIHFLFMATLSHVILGEKRKGRFA